MNMATIPKQVGAKEYRNT